MREDFIRLRRPKIAIRVDDISDYFASKAVERIINYHLANDVELTLGVIAGAIGNDTMTVRLVKMALENGCEVADHRLAGVYPYPITLMKDNCHS